MSSPVVLQTWLKNSSHTTERNVNWHYLTPIWGTVQLNIKTDAGNRPLKSQQKENLCILHPAARGTKTFVSSGLTSNNYICISVFGGKGNINSVRLKYRWKCRWRRTEFTQVLQEGFRTIDGPAVFLKIDTTGESSNRKSVQRVRDENLSLVVLQGVGPSTVGKY